MIPQLRSDVDLALAGIRDEDIEARECKHAVYVKSQEQGDYDDLLVVKELIHLKDGRRLPTLRFIENYKRPFWITAPNHRNHKDKKEWEDLSKVQRFTATQRNLTQQITRVLGYGNPRDHLLKLARNQYIYGAEIETPALIKHQYKTKWPDRFTPNVVAVMDAETDVVHGDGKSPILFAITCKNRVYVAVLRSWVGTTIDFMDKVHAKARELIGEEIDTRQLDIVLEYWDTPGQCCKAMLDRCHEWQPDLVAFWNMEFDMDVLVNTLQNENYDLADVFSDPRVPFKYRYFHYKKADPVKIKEDGTPMNKAWYDMWHWITCPASFIFVDAGSVYRQIRLAKGKEPSMSLEAILRKNLGQGKLYNDIPGITAKTGSLDWHVQMQQYAKPEYTVYNIVDCVRLEMMDEITRDLSTQISMLSGPSSYKIFTSNPKKTSDKLHFFCLEKRNRVLATRSDQMQDALDEFVIDKNDWIEYSVVANTHLH